MEKLGAANERLRAAREGVERDYAARIAELDGKERGLLKRLADLDERKAETAEANGSVDAADDDVVEINAGGKVIAAKRCTLTQLKGTRLEALFSGRWDKKLQRDNNGKIFLDVNPVGFQAVVDYLNEMMISSEDDPPAPPSVDDEHRDVLLQQMELIGVNIATIDSTIVKKTKQVERLHGWLQENGSDGELVLLYRSSRDGLSNSTFHSKCDNKGPTLIIIQKDDGHVVGGYSSAPWRGDSSFYDQNTFQTRSRGTSCQSARSFLFDLSERASPPIKMRLKNPNDSAAITCSSSLGPMFGTDLYVKGSKMTMNCGKTYESHPEISSSSRATYDIKEMEVFQVIKRTSEGEPVRKKQRRKHTPSVPEKVARFSDDINDAINAKMKSLAELESEIGYLEDCFRDEGDFVESFASGDTKDVISLNVSGTVMVTKRSTLCTAQDSVLAQQFDDTKWTEQGCSNLRVKEWTSDEVTSWVRKIDGIPKEVSETFGQNEITGRELLALKKEGLAMLGIARTGTLCVLLEEIEMLKKASQDVVTLVEHSPYCFGKILDHLRMKQIHSQGLVGEPALPSVCESQRGRFEKVVKYFFPGDSAKSILGEPSRGSLFG